MEQIFGCIVRILFQNPETGYTIASLKQLGKNDLTTIIGSLDINFEGEYLRLQGEWKKNSNKSFNNKLQFEFSKVYPETPKNLKTIFNYLTSKTIKGIGPKLAEKIIQKFGLNTLEIIENNPHVLKKIPGIGDKKCDSIISQLIKKKFIKDIILFLQNYDISIHFAYKIYKQYGDQSLEKIQTNPFILAHEISGISFKTADSISKKLGFPRNSNQRIQAAIEFSLKEMSVNGHTCSYLNSLLEHTLQILNQENNTTEIIPKEKIVHQIQELIIKQKIFYNPSLNKIWLIPLFLYEKNLASNLERINSNCSFLRSFDIEKALDWAQKQQNITLSESQKIAIKKTCLHKVHIITGGPGTGKSTITKILLKIFEKLSSKIILAAPTGKAAKRISEITNKRAFTIHSLLEYDFKKRRFKKNLENPLNIDIIIIDEVSMIDTILMHHLLKAIPSHAKVIFIGDMHQLPSIGPGNVLKDLIQSEVIPVTVLNEIFRQAKNSQIILNAHRINSGLFPLLKSTKNKNDFYFFKRQTPELTLECILSLYFTKIKKWHHLNSDSIQILSPMKKGILGTNNLNKVIQNLINPNKDGIIKQNEKFSLGDKVMQIKNNYNKEIFNGDIGYITKIDFQEKMLTINFENKYIDYSFNETDEITLAYATSIHKYQGSESACVIIPIHTSHFVMLHRNLLYTAVTRGKQLVILVGSGKAIAIAIARNQVQERCTGLKEALQEITLSN